MSGDRSKLPKWAQTELDRLEANVDFWKAKALDGPADSNTFKRCGGLNEDMPLGKGETIRFQLGEHWRDHVDVRINRNGVLEIYGGDGLQVHPRSSNLFEVTMERRD